MLTESRRRMCESSEAQEDLVDNRLRTAVTRVDLRGRVWSTLLMSGLVVRASKPSGGRVYGFGPQNPGGFEEEWTARGGIEEFASRRIYLMKGAMAVG
jgi:hypothetical protein